MVNPLKLMKFKDSWKGFEERHPKFVKFIMAVMNSGIGEDSIIDVKITLPDGREIASNMKVTKEDVELLKNLGEMGIH